MKRVQACYETSYLSVLFPRLGLSASSLTHIMRELGKNRDGICSYMRKGLLSYSGFILVDGHRIISESPNMPLLQMDYKPQVNLLYLLGRKDGMRLPLYHKQFSGSVPDCLALSDIAHKAGIGGSDPRTTSARSLNRGCTTSSRSEGTRPRCRFLKTHRCTHMRSTSTSATYSGHPALRMDIRSWSTTICCLPCMRQTILSAVLRRRTIPWQSCGKRRMLSRDGCSSTTWPLCCTASSTTSPKQI